MTRCAACHPLTFAGRIHEGHVGVRFNDHLGNDVIAWPRWKITLNDEDVTNRCAEALGGDEGWVILFDLPITVCRGLGDPIGHVRTTLHHGHVQIRRR